MAPPPSHTQQAAASNPPYPTSPPLMPLYPSDPQQDYAINGEETLHRSRSNSVSSTDTWNSGNTEDEEAREEDLPAPLKPIKDGQGRQPSSEELPAALRAGPPGGGARASQEASRNPSPNPWSSQPAHPPPSIPSYIPQKQTQEQASPVTYDVVSGQDIWGDETSSPQQSHPPPTMPSSPPPPPPARPAPSLPSAQPAELPGYSAPSQELANMSIRNDHLAPATDMHSNTANGSSPQSGPVATNPTGKSLDSQRSQHSNPWQNDLDREQERLAEERRSAQAPEASLLDDPVPALPRRSQEPTPPAYSPRQPLNVPVSEGPQSRTHSHSPSTQSKRQRSEFYHIKHVRWYDAAAAGNGRSRGCTRTSPILTQNANGPCPLLALVNALSLSTRDDVATALIETLRSREQITLGLLLDAVFEELVRRNEQSGHDLPDIGELYAFLVTLHTGMNVNPKFVQESGMPGTKQAGSFEQTREMRLYGTFNMPLVHGWLPPANSSVYSACVRSAPTFEDAQNIQFREEELEEKLRAQGLTSEEQQMFEDVQVIKQFLNNYSTQLTGYGLDAISSGVKPGQIAILFRNDHFSTLYKDPGSGLLMSLVTDAGYSSHDEIVWESLVDISGAESELFSGDFRPVGHGAAPFRNAESSGLDATYEDNSNDWQTVTSKKPRDRNSQKPLPADPVRDTHDGVGDDDAEAVDFSGSTHKTAEQEDHDLALALQLQEEEEEEERREAARRREEEQLSRQFLDRENSNEPGPQLPPRRTSNLNVPPRGGGGGGRGGRGGRRATSNPVPSRPAVNPRPAINPSSRTDDDTAPPPSYEQAASDRPYREPGSTPQRPPQGDPLGALGALQAQNNQSAFASHGLGNNQSTASVNTFNSAASGNRRRHSHLGGPGGVYSRQYSQQPGTGQNGVNGQYVNGTAAGTNRIEDERCLVM